MAARSVLMSLFLSLSLALALSLSPSSSLALSLSLSCARALSLSRALFLSLSLARALSLSLALSLSISLSLARSLSLSRFLRVKQDSGHSLNSSALDLEPKTPHPGPHTIHCRENMAHIRLSRPDSGLGFQVKISQIFQSIPSSLGSGTLQRYLVHKNPPPP